jgi:peroxiredoxin
MNAYMREWGLPSEPWTFLVGADGRIKAKFEGSVSVDELAAAVRRSLLA